VFKWMIPAYHMVNNKSVALADNSPKGYVYLLVLFVILAVLVSGIIFKNIKRGNKKIVLQTLDKI